MPVNRCGAMHVLRELVNFEINIGASKGEVLQGANSASINGDIIKRITFKGKETSWLCHKGAYWRSLQNLGLLKKSKNIVFLRQENASKIGTTSKPNKKLRFPKSLIAKSKCKFQRRSSIAEGLELVNNYIIHINEKEYGECSTMINEHRRIWSWAFETKIKQMTRESWEPGMRSLF